MDASYKIQRGIHVHLIQFFMCPEFWVHINYPKNGCVVFAFHCGRGVFHWFRWNYCTVTGLGYTPRKSNQPRGSRMAPR